MDLLNTFFAFNLTATVANAKAKISHFNAAGAAGTATSIALLTSVAVLFR